MTEKDFFARRFDIESEAAAAEIGLQIVDCPCGCGDYTFKKMDDFSLEVFNREMVK